MGGEHKIFEAKNRSKCSVIEWAKINRICPKCFFQILSKALIVNFSGKFFRVGSLMKRFLLSIHKPNTLLLQYHKHLFVHLGPERTLEDPAIEAIDIRQIYDKFPEKKGGLKELYEKGPPHLFFLVKFWVSHHLESYIQGHFETLHIL